MQPIIVESKVVSAARTHRGIGLGLIVLVTAGLIGGCGSSGSSTTTKTINLNTPHVAQAIEHSILHERHVHATVTCPAVIVQQKGKNFVCIATTRDSSGVAHKTPFAVTQKNDSGDVTYRAE